MLVNSLMAAGEEFEHLIHAEPEYRSFQRLSKVWELVSLPDEVNSSGTGAINFFRDPSSEVIRSMRQLEVMSSFAKELHENMEDEPPEVTRQVDENIWDLF